MHQNGIRFGFLLRAVVPALALSMLATAWCWWASGADLGLFLGTALLAALYIPGLALAEGGWRCLAALAAAVTGVGILWLAATNWADVTPLEWLKCIVVFATFAWAVAGSAQLLASASIPKPLAAGVTLFTALLWLTWPVWLSHALNQRLVNWLVPANPLFAINAVLKHLGAWDRAQLAYNQLTVLNQDVAYRFPRSIWPAVWVHLLVGVPGMWLCMRQSLIRPPCDPRTRCTAGPDRPAADTR